MKFYLQAKYRMLYIKINQFTKELLSHFREAAVAQLQQLHKRTDG